MKNMYVLLTAIMLIFMFGCTDPLLTPEATGNSVPKANAELESVPAPVTINLALFFTGPNTAAGSFDISGVVNDNGIVEQIFSLNGQPNNPGTAHGKKTLIGQDGQFDIRFQVRITPTGPTTAIAEGRFVIIKGTGSYEGFHGQGTTYIELDFVAGTLTGVYEGQAQFDSRN